MKIYVEKNGGLSEEGYKLDRMISDAIKPIVEFCVENGADLRVANHLAAQVVNIKFIESVLLNRFGRDKPKKALEQEV